MQRQLLVALTTATTALAVVGLATPAVADRHTTTGLHPTNPPVSAPASAGNVGVTVGSVSFTASDGLAETLHAGHHYRTQLMLVVAPGNDGSTATVTVQDGTVEGCLDVPVATATATPLRCRFTVRPHTPGQPPPASVAVTVTVHTPNSGDQVHVYPHALQQTHRPQG